MKFDAMAVGKFASLLAGFSLLATCASAQPVAIGSGNVVAQASARPAGRSEELRMWMTVGDRRFAITLADTAAARSLAAQLPMTLHMTDLHDNEKKVTLPKPLPTTVIRPGTIRTGDVLLWGADTLVVFYKTFESSYSYTRLGQLDDAAGLANVLGKGDVTVILSRN